MGRTNANWYEFCSILYECLVKNYEAHEEHKERNLKNANPIPI
jgi:hypothetical protein